MKQASYYCPQCQQPRLFTAEDLNHILYLLITVFMCGLFAPIWILISLTYTPVWRCSVCGFHDQEKYLLNPGLRQHEAVAAQAAQQARAAAKADAVGTPWEWWYWFEGKSWLVALIIAVLFVVVLIVAAALEGQSTRVAASPTPTPSDFAVTDRRNAARGLQPEVRKELPDAEVSAEGTAADELVIASAKMTAKWAKTFQAANNPVLARMRTWHFKTVLLRQKGGAGSWYFEIPAQEPIKNGNTS